MLPVEYVGIAAGTLSTAAFIPQAYTICVSGESDQLSLKTYTTFFIALSLWFSYGLMLPEGYGISLIVTNSIQICIVIFIIILIVQHRLRHHSNNRAGHSDYDDGFTEYVHTSPYAAGVYAISK